MPEKYAALLAQLEQRSGAQVDFRLAETPLFMRVEQLEEMAAAGAELTEAIIGNPDCLAAARRAIPAGYLVAGETPPPNFLTADFALVRDTAGDLVPRRVEIQAFPFIYGYQSVFCSGYRDVFGLDKDLRVFLCGREEEEYWAPLDRTIIAGRAARQLSAPAAHEACTHNRDPVRLTQAEIRIMYLWPDGGSLTLVLTLVRLGRGKMMGVDHNRDQQWVGASAAFYVCR
jgi:hypothetical protein